MPATARGHPVAEALAGAIAAGGLPKQALLDLVTAHEFDLFQDRMPGLTELEAYLGETYSRLIQMAAMILDRDAAPKASECAGPRRRGAGPGAGPGRSRATAIRSCRRAWMWRRRSPTRKTASPRR